MFKIKEPEFPKEFINCESCGCHGDDMKSILIFQAVNRNGKMVRRTELEFIILRVSAVCTAANF